MVPGIVDSLKEAVMAQRAAEARVKDIRSRLEMYLAAGAMEQWEDMEPGKFCFEGITLTRQSRTTWSYSSQLKGLMEAEKTNGMAKAKTSEFFRTELA